MNAGLLYLHFAVLTPSGKVAWLTLLKTSGDISLAAYHAYFIMFLRMGACSWLCIIAFIFVQDS
jgi:hypothetical protein